MTVHDQKQLLEETEKIDLEESSKLLIKGRFYQGLEIYSRILDKNPHSIQASSGYRICKFWINRQDILERIQFQRHRIKDFIDTWEKYEDFISKYGLRESQAHWSTLIFMHNQLAYLMHHIDEIQVALDHDPGIIRKFGEIFIQLQDWENAIQALESARSLKKDDAATLALLGEAYCQAENFYRGMAMFREAFFLDASSVPLSLIHCPRIREMITEMQEVGIKKEHYVEWMPVFSALYGVFNVKRSLSPHQLEELNRDTIQLEETYRNNRDNAVILPRLLNHYLWLLDYYSVQEEDKLAVGEIVSRLKTLDPRLYQLLIDTYKLENN